MKKIFFAVLVLFSTNLLAAEKLEKLVLSGPFASVSHPLAYIIENNKLADVAKKVEFVLWNNPDELRALTIQGGADFVAVPTNVGANLFNRGVKIRLLNVSVWGILGMVTRDNNFKTLKDFKGKEVVVPFRSDMPDIVFQTLLKKQGIDPKKDISIKYVATPIDAMQSMIMRREDNVLLAEPAISMALIKTKSFPVSIIAPTIYRSVDLQEEWGRVFGTNGDIPQAGIAELGTHSDEVVKRFNEEYANALAWYKANPKQAGELTEKYFPMFKAEAVEKSIPNVRLKVKNAFSVKSDLESFFTILLNDNPKLVGNKLPSETFYFSNQASAPAEPAKQETQNSEIKK